MNFIIRNKQLFGLLWEILVIIFFKFYNDYIFTDLDAIIFLSLLILPILFLELVSFIKRRKNLSKFKKTSKEIYEQIKLTVEKEFITRFKDIYSWHEFNKNEMQFAIGNEDMMVIKFDDNKTSLVILGTNIKYNFYYGKTLKGYQKNDKHGFEHYDVDYLYNELYLSIAGNEVLECLAIEYYLDNLGTFSYYDRENYTDGYIIPPEDIEKYQLTKDMLEQLTKEIEEAKAMGLEPQDMKLSYKKQDTPKNMV